VTFELSVCRFRFRARDTVQFPPRAGNAVRGLIGQEAEHRWFRPAAPAQGPSGLQTPPPPFVLRAHALDGRLYPPGQVFTFDIHLFDSDPSLPAKVALALRRMEREGIGPRRARAILEDADRQPVVLDLTPPATAPPALQVDFETPTELKGHDSLTEPPPFAVLVARARDRVSTLRALYGPGPADVDFRLLGELAGAVRLRAGAVRLESRDRVSSRTGDRHPIGGFTGHAVYEGALAPFLPWLEAAVWTGAGRHTVWGNGALKLTPLAE
jgi:hypothetical protein